MELKVIKIVLLTNEFEDHELWEKSLISYNGRINYRIVNLTKHDWYEQVHQQAFDILLAKPGCTTTYFKQLYDERVFILSKVLGYNIYPSADEIFIYENKRFLSSWLKANQLPHPKTFIFYSHEEAKEFLSRCAYPIVAKTNIGASGSGVFIIKNIKEAYTYLSNSFSKMGAKKRWGPNFSKGNYLRRGLQYVFNPSAISKKLKVYISRRYDVQSNFVLFQEYISHEYEWRVVRIGDSFFAHKKLKKGEKTSGSLLKGYENPPMDILNFVKRITDKHKLFSIAIDIFYHPDHYYLINEMQCIFGQSDPYQMLIDGKPGRYRYLNDDWIFEEGDFASNACYDLRVDFVVNKFFQSKQ